MSLREDDDEDRLAAASISSVATPPRRHRRVDSRRGDTSFDALALDVSGFGPNSSSTPHRLYGRDEVDRARVSLWRKSSESECELWDDYGVVEYLEKGLASPDDSTPEERVEIMRETLAETDILVAEGDLTDFLFHVARTKHGKVYIRVIRTLLLNRGGFFFIAGVLYT